MLRLYTDGSRNDETLEVGWAYALVDGDTVLLADAGKTRGSATDGEYLAIFHGLLAINVHVPVEVVTDRNDFKAILKGHGKRKKKKSVMYRTVLRKLFAHEHITLRVIKSGGEPMHRKVDTLSRLVVGMKSKSQMMSAKKRRRKAKEKSETVT